MKARVEKILNRLIPHRVVPFAMATQRVAELPLAIRELLFSSSFGPETVRFYETEFARAAGNRHAVSFASGRTALFALLEVLDLQPGDEIILPAYTCVVVANAIHYRRLKPVYVDIDLKDFNLRVGDVEKAITPRTRLIYAQHTFGQPCDVVALRRLADRHGLVLLEDCAHGPIGHDFAFGKVGTVGHVGFYSTDRTKYISTVLGGMAVTSDDGVAAKLKAIQGRAPLPTKKDSRRVALSLILDFIFTRPRFFFFGRSLQTLTSRLGLRAGFTDELSLVRPSDNYPGRLSAFQAAVGRSQLRALPRVREIRRTLMERLQRQFGENDREAIPALRFAYLVPDRGEEWAAQRDEVDRGVWFTSPLHGRDENWEALGLVPGQCPDAEYASRHIVNLPLHPCLITRGYRFLSPRLQPSTVPAISST